MHPPGLLCSIRVKLERVASVHSTFTIDQRGDRNDRITRGALDAINNQGGDSHGLDHPFGTID
jgi:hypothetical protein